MNIAIRYYTKSGNTKKLADAIAERLSIAAEDISIPIEERVDLLFLGTSYYAFDMDPCVKEFLKANKTNIGKVVCFGTSAMMKSMKKPMKRLTKSEGITFSDEEFHCRGEFKFANKGRPNADDLAAVADFAERVVENG